MSKYTKYSNNKFKTNYNSKFNTILESYNSLKQILSPNLNENNNIFVNALLELILYQLKIYINISNINDQGCIFEILNKNNQNLSKQMSLLYDIAKNNLTNPILDKDKLEKSDNLNSFHITDSGNFDLTDNFNQTPKRIKGVQTEKIKDRKFRDKIKDKGKKAINQLDNSKKDNEKIFKEIKDDKRKTFETRTQNHFKIGKKFNIKEKEVEKEKDKDKEKDKIMKKSVIKKSSMPKNMQKIKNIPKNTDNDKILKFDDYTSKTDRPFLSPNPKKSKSIKDMGRIETLSGDKNYKNLLFDSIKEEKVSKEFKRRDRKSKTVTESFVIPYLILGGKNADLFSLDHYINVTFTNRILDGIMKPKNSNRRKNVYSSTKIDTKKPKLKTNTRMCSSTVNIGKGATQLNPKIVNKKLSSINAPVKEAKEKNKFSINDFVIEKNNNKGEKCFYTKEGNVLITKKQKDILEDYINNYLFDEDEEIYNILDNSINNSDKKEINKVYNLIPMSKEVKKRLRTNRAKNKKYKLKGTSIRYDLNDISEVFEILPASFQIPIDDYFLKRKRASMFDRGIFQICHKVLDDYQELAGKEDRLKSKGKGTRLSKVIENNRNTNNPLDYKRFSSK